MTKHTQVEIPGVPGKRADEGIVELLGILNKKGVWTTSSCQGTLDEGAYLRVDGRTAVKFMTFFAQRIYSAAICYPPGPEGRLTIQAGQYGVQLKWNPPDYPLVLALAKELCDL